MGLYTPLTEHLKSLETNSWSVNFAEIERILGRDLPPSAYEYRTWWGNQKKGNHSQARAWREAGWEVREVDLKRRTVRLERQRMPGPGSGCSPTPQDLWDRARTLSGIEDKEKLIEAALKALIRQRAAEALIAMGGTMPDFEPAPRERPFG